MRPSSAVKYLINQTVIRQPYVSLWLLHIRDVGTFHSTPTVYCRPNSLLNDCQYIVRIWNLCAQSVPYKNNCFHTAVRVLLNSTKYFTKKVKYVSQTTFENFQTLENSHFYTLYYEHIISFGFKI